MSSKEITIYHNPRCSKSRETLQILIDNGYSPTIIEYLKHPPGTAELKQILTSLNLPAGDILRTTEDAYKAAELDGTGVNEDSILQALQDYPILLQRPIVIRGETAVIGRPPSNVLHLLD